LKRLEEKGLFKKITSKIRLGGDMVDMIPDVTFLSDIGSAGLAVLAAGTDTVGALIKRDLKGAGEEIVCGVADTAVTLIPVVEYARGVQFLRAMFGDKAADQFNPRLWARYGASNAYRKVVGGPSSVFLDTASETAVPDGDTVAHSSDNHEIVAEGDGTLIEPSESSSVAVPEPSQ